MKIVLTSGDLVTLTDAAGLLERTRHTMTLEQYQKHARDPAFVADVPAAAKASIADAVEAARLAAELAALLKL